MKRKLMSDLIRWKNKKHRKPLILWGARQTGKTWLMKEFGRTEYSHTVYISFYNNSRIYNLFERDYDVKRIIRALETELHETINVENTLLIFDEIQSAPRVVESLKYFCEDLPELSLISAGSLLGVSIHEGISFPVGKTDELSLHPMDFQEFLMAIGENNLSEYINDYTSVELVDHADRYKELLRTYFCTGGMPEVVLRYTETHDWKEVREVQLMITNQYEGDFGKHVNPRELPRIRMIWNHLPIQLAKENKKFFFGQMKKGARRSEYEIAIQWLKDAGLVHLVPHVSKPSLPLKAYEDLNSYKLFALDIGILGALSELDIPTILKGNIAFTEYKGALTEQYILQEIIAANKTPYYYSGEKSTYEVDFLLQGNNTIIPIEVKSEDNLRSKSLRFFYEKFKPEESALRFSTANYRNQEWMKNIPLWAARGVLGKKS